MTRNATGTTDSQPNTSRPNTSRLSAFCGLFPHPPIIVPDVGRDRLAECMPTVEACREFARRLLATRPARLFLVSPHSPRHHRAFGLWSGKRLRGDLGAFGAPQAGVDLANDLEAVAHLETAVADHRAATWSIPAQPLDHGALIPLWFLQEAGWDGPTSILSLPRTATPSDFVACGHAVAEALGILPGRAAVVASGDMSHRTRPGAPAGYHPRAPEFDRTLTALVAAGQLDEIAAIDPGLRELAAEDAADSSILGAATIGFRPHGAEVLSYEDPFGVGYLVAIFHDGEPLS